MQLHYPGHFTAWAPLQVYDGHHQLVRMFISMCWVIGFSSLVHLVSSLATKALV